MAKAPEVVTPGTVEPLPETPTIAASDAETDNANLVPASDATHSVEGDTPTLDSLIEDHAAPLENFTPAEGTQTPKRRGRPKGGKNTPKVLAPAFSALPRPDAPILGDASSLPAPAPSAPNGAMTPEVAGKWSANVLFNVGALIFGDIATPTKDEKAAIPQAFTDYYNLKGTPDIPPELGLIIAIGAYAIPRVMHEKMTQKREGFLGWFRGLFRRGSKSAPVSVENQENDETTPAPDSAPRSKVGWGA